MRSRLVLSTALALAFFAAPSRADDPKVCVAHAEKAQQLRRQHTLVAAREELLACASAACPTVVRTDCARWLDEVDATLPTISVRVTQPSGEDVSANVTVDGVPVDAPPGVALRVDPGAHVIAASAPRYERAEKRIIVAEGEKSRVVALVLGAASSAPTPPPPREEPRPQPQPEGSKGVPVASIALGGLGVAALGSFTYFGLRGSSEASDLRDGCNLTLSCTEDQKSSVESMYLAADISLGIAIVSLGAAAVIWLVNR